MRAGYKAHPRDGCPAASTEVVMARNEFLACKRLLFGFSTRRADRRPRVGLR